MVKKWTCYGCAEACVLHIDTDVPVESPDQCPFSRIGDANWEEE